MYIKLNQRSKIKYKANDLSLFWSNVMRLFISASVSNVSIGVVKEFEAVRASN